MHTDTGFGRCFFTFRRTALNHSAGAAPVKDCLMWFADPATNRAFQGILRVISITATAGPQRFYHLNHRT